MTDPEFPIQDIDTRVLTTREIPLKVLNFVWRELYNGLPPQWSMRNGNAEEFLVR